MDRLEALRLFVRIVETNGFQIVRFAANSGANDYPLEMDDGRPPDGTAIKNEKRRQTIGSIGVLLLHDFGFAGPATPAYMFSIST